MERIFIGVTIPKALTSAIAQLYMDPKLAKHLRWVAEENLHLTITFIGEVSTEKRELIQYLLRSINFSPFLLKIANSVETFPARAKKNIRVVHIPVLSGGEDSTRKWPIELNELKSIIDATLLSLESGKPSESILDLMMEDMNETEKATDNVMSDETLQATEATAPSKKRSRIRKSKQEFFQPHLTLARVKQRANPQAVLQTIQEITAVMQGSNETFWNHMVFPVTKFILFRSTLTPQGSIYEVLEEYHAV